MFRLGVRTEASRAEKRHFSGVLRVSRYQPKYQYEVENIGWGDDDRRSVGGRGECIACIARLQEVGCKMKESALSTQLSRAIVVNVACVGMSTQDKQYDEWDTMYKLNTSK
jgi:hypothetical protein